MAKSITAARGQFKTQTEFANALGCSQRSVNVMLSKGRATPGLAPIIAKVCTLKLSDLRPDLYPAGMVC